MMQESKLFKEYIAGKCSILSDFSYAGCKEYNRLTEYNARELGIKPGSGEDMTDKIQQAICHMGKNGGGVLLFDKGRYDVNCDPVHQRNIDINYSNIILKGAGSGQDGTVIYSHHKNLQEKLPYLSKGLIHTANNLFGTESFLSPKYLAYVGKISQGAKRGDTAFRLEGASRLQKGDCLIICMYDDEAHSLARQLIYPLEPDAAWSDLFTAYERKSPPYQWLAEIDSVNGEMVKLTHPIHRDFPTQYHPCAYKVEMLENIGVEEMRFESAWDGGEYYHHKNAEVDYGWNGIVMHRVKNGWVKNVKFKNFTQSVQLRDCKNVTVENITIDGHSGHYGIKCYAHTSDCLMENIDVNPVITHGLGVEGTTQGNVFKDVRFNNASTEIDLHGGGLPSFNLFENVQNIAKVSGGGGIPNLPYCGVGNVYWNCTFRQSEAMGLLNTYREHEDVDMELKGKRAGEFFHAWYWSFYKRHKALCDHKMYVGSIVVGLKGEVCIHGNREDRADGFIYTECINGGVQPESLYGAQLDYRRKEGEKQSL